ncbi:hypothetical protein [Pedobacter mendelii]|uniref:hypothetical protein n=1 Tax=Pedobacter mendelii TaxID=1908240 RepID=UPI00166D7BC0
MEEINSFFDHTTLYGVSYVVVQHLSANFKSRMTEVLVNIANYLFKRQINGFLWKSTGCT